MAAQKHAWQVTHCNHFLSVTKTDFVCHRRSKVYVCVCVCKCATFIESVSESRLLAVFKTLRAKNLPGRSFLWVHHVTRCAPAFTERISQTSTIYLQLDISCLLLRLLLLSTPCTLHFPPNPESMTLNQASVREGLVIDTKCGTNCSDGDPQTHMESSTQTSQPPGRACSVVNSWHAVQHQRQLFISDRHHDHKGGKKTF